MRRAPSGGGPDVRELRGPQHRGREAAADVALAVAAVGHRQDVEARLGVAVEPGRAAGWSRATRCTGRGTTQYCEVHGRPRVPRDWGAGARAAPMRIRDSGKAVRPSLEQEQGDFAIRIQGREDFVVVRQKLVTSTISTSLLLGFITRLRPWDQQQGNHSIINMLS